MKIATWNLDFLRKVSTKEQIGKVTAIFKEVDADIWILTETNSVVSPGEEYVPLTSEALPDPKPYDDYKSGDHEVIIWSKRKYCMSGIRTGEPCTSVCAKVEIDGRELIVYGTVIGILGPVGSNRDAFMESLKQQIKDWHKICNEQNNVCIVGDFNICWSKRFPKTGRDLTDRCFDELGVLNLTRNVEENIDHIAISNSFLHNAIYDATPHRWNMDKKLSDHVGISMSFEFPLK